ncbi:MAG: DnaJ-like cysteine-rich domain-containing protein, partial [Planctomycetota bacterium]
MPTITCPDCGAELKARGARAFCRECRKAVSLEKPKKSMLVAVVVTLILAAIAGGAVIYVVSNRPPEPPRKTKPRYPLEADLERLFKRGKTEFSVFKFAVDQGDEVLLHLLITAYPRSTLDPQNFKLDTGAVGHEVESHLFDRIIEEEAHGAVTKVLEFRVPNSELTLVVTEGGEPATKIPVHVPSTGGGGGRLGQTVQLEGWSLTPQERIVATTEGFEVELLMNGEKKDKEAITIRSDYLPMVVGDRVYMPRAVPPAAAKNTMPGYYKRGFSQYYFRYPTLPRDVKEVRIQVKHRTLAPSYIAFRPAKLAPELPPVAEKPPAKEPPPGEPVADEFSRKEEEKKQEETKKEAQPSQEELTGSPLAALRKLRNDLSDESKAKAKTIVRNGIGRELTKSVEAWNAGKWTEFRDHLIEAAQLSRLYSDKHSKTVMQMLFTLQRELEVRADDLIRLVAAYAKTKNEEAARGLIAEARKDPFFNGLFGKELSSLEGNISGWCSSAPSDSDILSEVERWTNRLKVKLGSCPGCSGLGGVICEKCKKEGFVLGDCSRCKGGGRVNCQLCGGSGKNKHKGYVGIIFLDIPRD